MPGQDIYTEIANKIADALDRGVAPWRRPWRVSRGSPVPTNLSTGVAYSGINTLVLACAQLAEGYSCALWLTYVQAKRLGAQVRRGEKGTRILIYKRVERKRPSEGQEREYMLATAATLFNVDQIDGLELPDAGEPVEPITAAEQLVAAYLADGPAVAHGGNVACYSASRDAITMPPRGAFDSAAAYYSTLFHEIGHSTGHESRLARDLAALGNVHTYAREELVAEFAAAFLRARAGIADDVELEQSAAYLRGWAAKIREDPRVLTWAAAQAQRAVDLVIAKRA